MLFRKATIEDCQLVTDIVQNTKAEIYLDASLPACQFYEHLGYKTHHHDSWKCENGVVLVYDVMTKKIK